MTTCRKLSSRKSRCSDEKKKVNDDDDTLLLADADAHVGTRTMEGMLKEGRELAQISENIVGGKYYQALKLARKLMDYEKEIMSRV